MFKSNTIVREVNSFLLYSGKYLNVTSDLKGKPIEFELMVMKQFLMERSLIPPGEKNVALSCG